MIQEQGKGNVTVGQSHARMLLDWAVAAAAGESGNGRHPERALQGKGGRSWDMARIWERLRQRGKGGDRE